MMQFPITWIQCHNPFWGIGAWRWAIGHLALAKVSEAQSKKLLWIYHQKGLRPSPLYLTHHFPTLAKRSLWVESASDEQTLQVLLQALMSDCFSWIVFFKQEQSWTPAVGRQLFFLSRKHHTGLIEWADTESLLTPSPLPGIKISFQDHKAHIVKIKNASPHTLDFCHEPSLFLRWPTSRTA